jgi:DNA modification methylase
MEAPMDERQELHTRHELVTGDARRLDFIPDGSVQLAVTSPPYPMIALWDGLFATQDPLVARALQEERGPEAFDLIHSRIFEPAWREIWRVLADGGFACINVGDAVRTMDGNFRLYANGPRIIEACHRIGFDVLPQIVWRKPTNSPNKFMGSGVLPAGAYVTLEHEHVIVLRKGRKRDFSAESARRNRLESAIFWEERNIWFSDLWDFRGAAQGLGGKKLAEELAMLPPPVDTVAVEGIPEAQPFHPEPQAQARDRSAAFPLELAERLVLMYSVQGDNVLDPFLGTATTTLAAIGNARNSIGVELDPELAAYGVKRCSQEVPALNQRVADRLARHAKWVHEYQAQHPGSLRHRNATYKLPVMTIQEEQLRLHYVAAMQAEGVGSARAVLRVGHHPYG